MEKGVMQGAVWCFKGDAWTLGTEYLRVWGARYAPLITSEPSRSFSDLLLDDPVNLLPLALLAEIMIPYSSYA